MTSDPGGDAPKPAPTDKELGVESRQIAVDQEQTKLAEARHALKLRKIVGAGAMVAMLLQLLAANYVFFRYGDAVQWRFPVGAISAWLGATVVQVVGVVVIITRYLFPPEGAAPK